jgi:hypothetical protein
MTSKYSSFFYSLLFTAISRENYKAIVFQSRSVLDYTVERRLMNR